jgi:DNA-binding CsgD family transcriptional regulator
MLRRGQTTTLQERLDIGERAAAGESDPEIATALGCSVWTVRKWRRWGQQQGRLFSYKRARAERDLLYAPSFRNGPLMLC